mgnify:CR=1 FL=1
MAELCKIFFWSRSTNPDYRFLSNFAESPMIIDGKRYRTTEHYYQSMKYEDEWNQEQVRNAGTPARAKQLGRMWPLRAGWEEKKEEVMLRALREKFKQNGALKEKLLKTDQCELHEDSPHDMYWGVKGKDRLGKLLMQVRDELRS